MLIKFTRANKIVIESAATAVPEVRYIALIKGNLPRGITKVESLLCINEFIQSSDK